MNATIAANKELSPRYYKMTLTGIRDVAAGEPGQFVMMRGDWDTDPLLPRPLSIYRLCKEEGSIEIVYRVTGRGTRRLSRMAAGQCVDIIAPLGRPFPRPDTRKRVILAAGSIGAPPLVALAESMPAPPLLILGGRSKDDVVFLREELQSLGIETLFVTEDGSFGLTGTTVSVLADHVSKDDQIYACGPNGMLAAIARLSGEIGFEAYVSFEERMACGIGICLGCAARHKNGNYVHVCKDGPVFSVTDIDWDSL